MTAIQSNFEKRRPPTPDDMLRPRVEILEDNEGILMYADLPGVANEHVNLQIDGDTLTLDAEAKLDMPDGLKPLHAEVASRRYRRAFALSSELDAEHISASLSNGVLSVRIPKKRELQPRRIEIRQH